MEQCHTLVNHVYQSLRGPCSVQAGDKVLVAVSGGADSTALLHALAQLAPAYPFDLTALHIHHGMRGSDADRDAARVRALCESLKVPIAIEMRDVPGYARLFRIGIEEAGRAVRSSLLIRHATACGAHHIATAHTRNDNVETILLNILRGSGLTGLTGLRAAAGIKIRPMLKVERPCVEQYCAEMQLEFCTDSTNFDTRFLRNRVRLKLLPQLCAAYSPHCDDALLRMANILAADDDLLNDAARLSFQEVSSPDATPGVVSLVCEKLGSLPPGLRRRVLRLALVQLVGSSHNVTLSAVERLDELVQATDNRLNKVTLAKPAICAVLEEGLVTLSERTWPAEARHCERLLALHGSVHASEFKATIEIKPANYGHAGTSRESDRYLIVGLHCIEEPVTVRNRRNGDRVAPYGGVGTRKLQDILTDLHMPRLERDWLPVFADARGPFWVPGYAVDKRIVANPGEPALQMSIIRTQEQVR